MLNCYLSICPSSPLGLNPCKSFLELIFTALPWDFKRLMPLDIPVTTRRNRRMANATNPAATAIDRIVAPKSIWPMSFIRFWQC
ncbi:Hypothetical protein P9211_06671 [Prochlorococcus marinus str. MIT 9211]|uniref:Uncharacterized protein n=1 Tax=Prochlorococcus marinus (strain MIT 9211) TaxID=93059 RepID=A9B9T6_PROM4|nr:Hypothetical protein P9211_06671 [Prochlorococcus marinus str. MIT 9211]